MHLTREVGNTRRPQASVAVQFSGQNCEQLDRVHLEGCQGLEGSTREAWLLECLQALRGAGCPTGSLE